MPVINFGYRNHFLDEASPLELRARLVYIFRVRQRGSAVVCTAYTPARNTTRVFLCFQALKIDTVITFNPWGENPQASCRCASFRSTLQHPPAPSSTLQHPPAPSHALVQESS